MDGGIFRLNGRVTGSSDLVKDKIARAIPSYFWSSSENSANNAWNINASSGQVNNNNKNNSIYGRAVVALDVKILETMVSAYVDCCRSKKSSVQCCEYRTVYEEDLVRLSYEVQTGIYYPGTSIRFIVSRPRYREVFASAYRDRIVQHWVCLRTNPLFEERFNSQGNVSFNCRVGYGSMAAVRELERRINLACELYGADGIWIGKCDIKSFFMEIDHDVLTGLLIPFIKERYDGDYAGILCRLINVIVYHRPQDDCEDRSLPCLERKLPASKSLKFTVGRKGLPIGNFTSQEFAGFDLSFLDGFILGRCGVLGLQYVRFVDDFVLVGRKEDILSVVAEVKEWISSNLKLDLHPKKFYLQHCTKGVKFVGQVIKPGRRYTSNATVSGFVNRTVEVERLCLHIVKGKHSVKDLKKLAHCVSSLNSYMGFFIHTDSYALRRKYLSRLSAFWKCCYVTGRFSVVKIRKRFMYNFKLQENESSEFIRADVGRGKA